MASWQYQSLVRELYRIDGAEIAQSEAGGTFSCAVTVPQISGVVGHGTGTSAPEACANAWMALRESNSNG
jgi:hypothetical protein